VLILCHRSSPGDGPKTVVQQVGRGVRAGRHGCRAAGVRELALGWQFKSGIEP